jgi:hypothetical protein
LEKSDALSELTEQIREKYLEQNGRLMNELGQLLAKGHSLCKEAGIRYEDWIDRVLCLPRGAAKTAVRVSSLQVNPKLGWETMKIVASQTTPEKRAAAEEQFFARRSPDAVKVDLSRKGEDEDPKDRLVKEKKRLEKTIAMLHARLDQVEQSLSNM